MCRDCWGGGSSDWPEVPAHSRLPRTLATPCVPRRCWLLPALGPLARTGRRWRGWIAYEASGAVQYYVRRREDLRGKRIVIAGGGDSAVDWALALKDIARVAVVHRRPKFRAAPESAAQLDAAARNGEIEMVIPYQLHALHGVDGVLGDVEVATLRGETRRLPADVLLPFFGLSMDLGPIAAWGLDLELHHVRIDPATCATSVPGVFAIGDVVTYPGQAEADPAGVQRSGNRGARHIRRGASWGGIALRVLDDERGASRLVGLRRFWRVDFFDTELHGVRDGVPRSRIKCLRFAAALHNGPTRSVK